MRPSEVTISARNSYRRQNRKPAGAAVTIWCSPRLVFRPLAFTRSWGTKCLPCWTSIRAPIGPSFCTNGYADACRGNGLGPRQVRQPLGKQRAQEDERGEAPYDVTYQMPLVAHAALMLRAYGWVRQ